MVNQILVPVDGSESTDEVLYYTHTIASCRPNTALTLLHVTSDEKDSAANGRLHLKTLSDLLSAEGWPVDTQVRSGDPVGAITSAADEISASLIVMSTHGRSGLERIHKGSITESVLRVSNCPVFILHSERPEPPDRRADHLFKRILVPLDGTSESSAILPCVQQFALFHDSTVILFHDGPKDSKGATEDEGSQITHIRAMLEEQSVQMANAGVRISVDWTSYRHPIREILDTVDAMNIDLVAMATHTTSQESQPLEGSVTADVIRHAHCPLLVWSAAHCNTGVLQ
jgi:nucleotide-binding universal stress UspA family protein